MVWRKDDFNTWTNDKTGSEIDVSHGSSKAWFVFLTRKEKKAKIISPALSSESRANTWALKWMKGHPNS